MDEEIYDPQESEDSPSDAEDVKERRRASRMFEAVGVFFLEVIKIALLAGITIGFVRYFIFKPFYVKGQSMESTFFEKEYLIIDELTYRFREPDRGEVLVFHSPIKPDDFYLKRIIGLPGERIKVEDGKVVVYNDEHPQGFVLDEPYLDQGTVTQGSQSVSLEEGEYYVLGDNREESLDSRRFGAIDTDSIIGKVFFRGYPFTRVGILKNVTYEE